MEDWVHLMPGRTGPAGLSQEDAGDPDDMREHHNLGRPRPQQQRIGDILQQIMAVVDESLDEAQAR